MPRLIIAIGLLVGFVAGVSAAEPIEKVEYDFADSIETLDKRFSDRLEAEVEEISSFVVSAASGAWGLAVAKNAESDRMRCWVAGDHVLECMIFGRRDAGSGRISDSPPASPAGN